VVVPGGNGGEDPVGEEDVAYCCPKGAQQEQRGAANQLLPKRCGDESQGNPAKNSLVNRFLELVKERPATARQKILACVARGVADLFPGVVSSAPVIPVPHHAVSGDAL